MTTPSPPSLVLWCGPVSPEALAGIVWQQPTQIVTFGQGIAGPDGSQFSALAFANLAAWARQQTPSGDILDGLLASRKLPPVSSYAHIAVAGFSAGHALLNPLLLENSGRIAAAIVLDACYSDTNAQAKPGYVSFGTRAAKRDRLMVYTAGAGGGGPAFTTGSQCARASFNSAVGFARTPVTPLPPSALATLPAPDAAKAALWARSGDLFLLDYGSQIGHTQHAWQLAKPVFEAFLVPFLGNGLLPPSLAPGPVVQQLVPNEMKVLSVPPAPPSTDPQDMPVEERPIPVAPPAEPPADQPPPGASRLPWVLLAGVLTVGAYGAYRLAMMTTKQDDVRRRPWAPGGG